MYVSYLKTGTLSITVTERGNLESQQNADGSFGRGRYGKHVGITALCALALVPGLGRNVNGSSRWLYIGPQGWNFSFQPSELAKWAVVLALAWGCAPQQNDLKDASVPQQISHAYGMEELGDVRVLRQPIGDPEAALAVLASAIHRGAVDFHARRKHPSVEMAHVGPVDLRPIVEQIRRVNLKSHDAHARPRGHDGDNAFDRVI